MSYSHTFCNMVTGNTIIIDMFINPVALMLRVAQIYFAA